MTSRLLPGLVLRFAAALVLLFASSVAEAAPMSEALTIRLHTLGEEAPAQVCVVSAFSSIQAGSLIGGEREASSWVAVQDALKKRAQAAKPSDALSKEGCAPDYCESLTGSCTGKGGEKPPEQVVYACASNVTGEFGEELLPLGKQVVFFLEGATPSSLELEGDIVRMQVTRSTAQLTAPVDLSLVGGAYFPTSLFPKRSPDGHVVDLDLRPRCISRNVVLPAYACHGGVAPKEYAVDKRKRTLEESQHSPAKVDIVMDASGLKRASTIEHCGHVFESTWDSPLPPAPMAFRASTFWFEWSRTCFAPLSECPKVVVPGASQPKMDQDIAAAICKYTVEGKPTLPVEVQFSFEGKGTPQRWNETLHHPGEQLFDFVPEQRRRITINWSKFPGLQANGAPDPALEERCSEDARTRTSGYCRDRWFADEIYHVEIITAEGRVRSVPIGTRTVTIPELSCTDLVYYRYVGTRNYKSKPVKVDVSGEIVLDPPEELRDDNFSIAFVFGAGPRIIPGTGSRVVGPYGEAAAILVFRHFRDAWHLHRPAVDFELRGGAIVAGQPFCSRSVSAPGGVCRDEDWETITYWRAPFTFGANFHLARHFSAGIALGGGVGVYHNASDAVRVPPRGLFVARTQIAYKLVDWMAFELGYSLFANEEVHTILFDDAGIVSDEFRTTTAHLLGITARIDDLLR